MEIVSDWKETVRLRIVEGHKTSGITFLEARCFSIDMSCTGVVLDCRLGGEGRFLSAETARLGTGDDDEVLWMLEGDIYLGLMSLLLERSLAPLFLSAAGSNGDLEVSTSEGFHIIV